MDQQPKLIGLSFSRCMGDLLSGEIQIEQVQKLITGTSCPTEKDFIEVIQQYKQLGYWKNYTVEEAVEIYHQIKHLIWQPRLEGKGYPQCSEKWTESEDSIIWQGVNNE